MVAERGETKYTVFYRSISWPHPLNLQDILSALALGPFQVRVSDSRAVRHGNDDKGKASSAASVVRCHNLHLRYPTKTRYKSNNMSSSRSASKPSSSSRSGSSSSAKPSSRSREGGSSSKGSSSRDAEPSSSRSRGTSDRREAVPFPSTVAIVNNDTAFGTDQTVPFWPEPEFGDKTEIKNVNAKTCKGTWIAAGTMFPLGMAIPSNTVGPFSLHLNLQG